jgi:hypothetical protein
MSERESPSTARREFLGQLALSAVAIAGTACAAPAAPAALASTATAPSGAPRSTSTAWDDSWFSRLTAKHRAVFDSPELDSGGGPGTGAQHASRYLTGMRDALGASGNDVQAVVVIRHKGIPLAFNDAMWAKYALGETLQVKAPGGSGWATKNPIAGPRSTGRSGAAGGANAASAERPQANLAWLAAHGHILLGCDAATNGYAADIATRVNGNAHAIYEELKQNLVPGLILQPNGIYAVHRAQEAGCTYIRSS